jgi:hypothetical protein
MKYWEIIAGRLSKAGWSLGWVSAIGLLTGIATTESALLRTPTKRSSQGVA